MEDVRDGRPAGARCTCVLALFTQVLSASDPASAFVRRVARTSAQTWGW
jgi:hypothetical protein